jgi:hypothetical protein
VRNKAGGHGGGSKVGFSRRPAATCASPVVEFASSSGH